MRSKTVIMKILLITVVAFLMISSTALMAQDEEAKAHFNAGIDAEQAGDKATAIKEYRAAIARDSSYSSPYLYLGVVLSSQKEYSAAVTNFTKVTELDPRNLEGWKSLGIAATNAGNLTVGDKAFTQALKLKPNDVELTEAYAMLYYINKSYDKAIPKLNDLIKLKANDKQIFFALGKSYQEIGDNANAIAGYESAIKIDPKYNMAYFELGNIYTAQEDWGPAIRKYKKAVECDPNHYQSWFNLGSACVAEQTAESIVDAYDSYKKFLSLTKSKNSTSIKNMRAQATGIVQQLKDYFDQAGIEYTE